MEAVVGTLIPLAAIVMGIGLAFWSLYLEHQQRRLQFEERRIMIEKGMQPPPMVPYSRHRPPTLEDTLRRGTIMVFLGIGLIAAMGLVFGVGGLGGRGLARLLAIGGPIVLLIGVGHLVYYRIAKRDQSGATAEQRNSP
jgi:hypothetical protein